MDSQIVDAVKFCNTIAIPGMTDASRVVSEFEAEGNTLPVVLGNPGDRSAQGHSGNGSVDRIFQGNGRAIVHSDI
jgi:hypothetical protein